MFLVVLCTLIINTLVDIGPIIFLKLAEGTYGQYDAIVFPQEVGKDGSDISRYTNQAGAFVNYTRVKEAAEEEFNLAPRKQYCGVSLGVVLSDDMQGENGGFEQEIVKPFPSRDWLYSDFRPIQAQGCLMLFDTKREREIGLGSRYDFQPMGPGECMLNEMMAAKLQVSKGDIVYV